MRKWLVLCALALFVSCGGGGSHGPTEPPPPQVVQVAGTWRGLWFTSGLTQASILTLTQSGSTLNGTVSILSSSFTVKGTATSSGISWSVVGGGCGSLTGTGTAANLAPADLIGIMTLDTRGCTSPGLFTGPIQWIRGSSSVASGKASGSLDSLALELKREVR